MLPVAFSYLIPRLCPLLAALFLSRPCPPSLLDLSHLRRAAPQLITHPLLLPRRAEIGGITIKEINNLELEFLFRTGFGLTVTREEYDWHASQLLAQDPAAAAPAAAPFQLAPCAPGMGAPAAGGKGGAAEEAGKVPSYCNIADASAAFALSGGRDSMVVE